MSVVNKIRLALNVHSNESSSYLEHKAINHFKLHYDMCYTTDSDPLLGTIVNLYVYGYSGFSLVFFDPCMDPSIQCKYIKHLVEWMLKNPWFIKPGDIGAVRESIIESFDVKVWILMYRSGVLNEDIGRYVVELAIEVLLFEKCFQDEHIYDCMKSIIHTYYLNSCSRTLSEPHVY